jgi:hypothetical protein
MSGNLFAAVRDMAEAATNRFDKNQSGCRLRRVMNMPEAFA